MVIGENRTRGPGRPRVSFIGFVRRFSGPGFGICPNPACRLPDLLDRFYLCVRNFVSVIFASGRIADDRVLAAFVQCELVRT